MTKISIFVFLTIISLVHAQEQKLLTQSQAWGYGVLTGLGVSAIGFGAAILVVLIKKCFQETTFKVIVNLLYALGCGALLGDVTIHILPQSFTSQDTNSKIVSLVFMLAIVFFLVLQRIFEGCGVAHKHWGEQDHHHENECKEMQTPKGNGKVKNNNSSLIKVETINIGQQIKNNNLHSSQTKINPPKTQQLSDQSQNQNRNCCQNLKGKGSAGYLNLLSSFIHNFFDGLAIGIAFASKDKHTYIPIIIAVFAHEIPRQIGDVGILLKNGFNPTQTILTNGIINCLSIVGVLVGLGLGTMNDAVQVYILTFVAGNFIYISADIWRNLLKNKSFVLKILQIFTFSIGVGSMYLVLLAQSGGKHEH